MDPLLIEDKANLMTISNSLLSEEAQEAAPEVGEEAAAVGAEISVKVTMVVKLQ